MIKRIEYGYENEKVSGISKKNRIQLQSSRVVNGGSGGWGKGRILSLLLGFSVLLISLGIFVGGSVILWSQNAIAADDGYVYTDPMRLSANSYAVVQNDIHPKVENSWWPFTITEAQARGWPFTIKEAVSIKVKATSNNGKPVFIGVATKQSALTYFDGVNVDKLVLDNWTPNGVVDLYQTLTYQSLPGGSPQTPPSSQLIWTAHASGDGAQTLEWSPSTGDYWLVVMNADGSKVLDATIQIGARIAIFSWTGWGIVFSGIIVASLGVAIIYFGAIRRH